MEESLSSGIDYRLLVLAQKTAEKFEKENSCPRVHDFPKNAASMNLAIENSVQQRIKIAYERPEPVISYEKRYITQEQAAIVAQHSQGLIPIEVFFIIAMSIFSFLFLQKY